jgi:hypothetical protein
MTKQTDLYREYASKAQADADAATLENVRERNQRAADAWLQMAERQERTDRARAAREGITEMTIQTQQAG